MDIRSCCAAVALALVLSAPALAEEVEASQCFDALVTARIAKQTPTIARDCGSDCIVMAWPWVVELSVEKVVAGRVSSKRLTVLTVQHTYFQSSSRRWWLRNNDLGGFNVVLDVDPKEGVPACPKGTPAARAYVRPSPGKTLEDMAREGEDYYGPGPEQSGQGQKK